MAESNPLYWQDEILQILYWMRGEGLGEVVSFRHIMQFLNIEERDLRENIRRLVEIGCLGYGREAGDGVERVRLTKSGIEEGKRRFLDEFEPYLGHESHLVCDDPNCDCHDPDWQGVCVHLTEKGLEN